MTPKEKAQELIRKYMSATNETSDFKMELYYHIQAAKKCALIAVDEILEVLTVHYEKEWFEEVKQEIEAL